MARIPLQVAQRSLDTGSVVSYPSGSPVGSALAGFGEALQGVAARFQKQEDEREGFNAKIKENEFNAALAGLEDDASKNAPADANGLHDGVYGQIGPDNRPVKPGSFDKLFDDYMAQMPASKRADFAAKKEAYRLDGSNRLARVQYNGQQDYYKVNIQKTQNDITNSMAMADPNDAETFDKFKQQGLDIIEQSGLPALEKDVAKTNWLANADETLFKTKLAKDPSFATNARAALGLAPPVSSDGTSVVGAGAGQTVVGKIIGVESGGNANAKNPRSSASGLGQFIDSTWLNTVRRYRPDIAAGKSSAQILALKNDPALGREMTTRYTQENAEFLQNRAIQTTAGNLYLAHFLGPQGAVNALKADPGASVESVLGGDVVNANPFLRGKSVSELVAWSNKKMGGASGAQPVSADPQFANIPLDRRLVLANQADVENNQRIAAEKAVSVAQYAAHKDALELQVVQGQIADENLIANDRTLNDGDKATLIRSFRSQNKESGQTQADLSALSSETLVLDAYSSEGKKRADNLFTQASKSLPAEQVPAVAGAIIRQTGVVPEPVINTVRRGLSSTNAVEVLAAAETAQRISAIDPAALGRRDGGGVVQQAADDYSYMVNTLNLTPQQAAQRLMDNNNPEKKRERKALEPAAKAFLKTTQEDNVAALFDEGVFSATPALGFDEQQAAGIQADYLAIAEDQFYQANGDPDLAKSRAQAEMKRLYGVSSITGQSVVMKHPPDRYWPKSIYGSRESEGFFDRKAVPTLDYVRTQIANDIKAFDPSFSDGEIKLTTVPETDADVKAGRLPGYGVMWKDQNGNYQAFPGKVWRPDTTKALEWQKRSDEQVNTGTIEDAEAAQVQELQQLPYRQNTVNDIMSGSPTVLGGPRDIPDPLPRVGKPTVQDRLDERRDELFENAPLGNPL